MNAGNLMRPGLLAAEWNPPFLDLTDAEKAPCRRSPTPGGVAVFFKHAEDRYGYDISR